MKKLMEKIVLDIKMKFMEWNNPKEPCTTKIHKGLQAEELLGFALD